MEPTAVAKLPSGQIVMAPLWQVIESSRRHVRQAEDTSETILDLDLDDKQGRPVRFPILNAVFGGMISNIVSNR